MCVSLATLQKAGGELALLSWKLGFCSSLNFVSCARSWLLWVDPSPSGFCFWGEEGTPVYRTGLHPREPQCLIGEVRLMVTISWDFCEKVGL